MDSLGVSLDYCHAGAPQPGRKLEPLTTEISQNYEKIILLVRDPRDTVVSWYHHATKRLNSKRRYTGTMSQFVRDPLYGIAKVVEFQALWLAAARADERFFVLRYEEMRADTVSCLRAVLLFLQRDFSEAQIQAIAADHEFDRMQDRERNNAFDPIYAPILGLADEGEPQSLKLRRGKVGGYVDEMSESDLAFCACIMARGC